MTDIPARIERVQQMEARLNTLHDLVKSADHAVEALAAALPDFAQLFAYYYDVTWREDHAADTRCEVPQDMPRGVLSKDAVWELMTTLRELSDRMTEVSEEALRER